MINQILGQPLLGGIGRLLLRLGAPEPSLVETVGPRADVSFAADADRLVWDGSAGPVQHRVTLSLHPTEPAWLWHRPVRRTDRAGALRRHPRAGCRPGRPRLPHEQRGLRLAVHRPPCRPPSRRCGPVVMSRQNLAQGGRHPWVAHGCLEGAAASPPTRCSCSGRATATRRIDPCGRACRASGCSTRSPAR